MKFHKLTHQAAKSLDVRPEIRFPDMQTDVSKTTWQNRQKLVEQTYAKQLGRTDASKKVGRTDASKKVGRADASKTSWQNSKQHKLAEETQAKQTRQNRRKQNNLAEQT